MAALEVTFTTSEIALSVATRKTVIQLIAASNHRARLNGWGIYFDGTSSSAEPVQVELIRQTTAIGGTPSAVTGRKKDPGADETVQTTAQVYGTSPTEPTDGDLMEAKEVHPQSGYEKYYPAGKEIIVQGGGRVAIVATAPAAVNCRAFYDVEE